MPHLTKFKVKKTSVYQISNHTYTRSELLNQPSSVEKNSIQIAKFTYVCYMCSLKINVLPYLLREKIVIYCTYLYSFFLDCLPLKIKKTMQSHHKVVVTPDQETTTGGTKNLFCKIFVYIILIFYFTTILLFSRIDQMEMRGLHL